MRVETSADGSIRIEDRFHLLRGGLLICVALSVVLAAFQAGADAGRAALIPLAIALACAALALAIEDSDFRFDAVSREVRWTKRRLIGRRSGTIPFAEIDDVVLEVRTERSDSGLGRSQDCRVFLVARATSLALGSTNLDLRRARDAIALPVLSLLGRSSRELIERGLAR